MSPGMKGKISPEVLDELMEFIDSHAADGGGDTPAPPTGEPAVAVEIEAKPEGMPAEGEKACPHCGKSY